MPAPEADAGSAGNVVAADAARLVEVRARQVAADFRIDDDNASAVADILRRLDGIPLTIELAATRVRVLAPDQIAKGPSDRFESSTGGVRTATERQRTLEASLERCEHEVRDRPFMRFLIARLDGPHNRLES